MIWYPRDKVCEAQRFVFMPRHFTDEEKSEIQERLITVGKQLFIRYGVEKTTIADIATEANVGKGTFYSFFVSKGDLFMVIYSREWHSAYKMMEEKYLNRKGELSELVLEYLRDNRSFLLSNPILAVVYNRSTLSMISDKSVVRRLLEFRAMNAPRVTRIVDSWFAAKDIQSPVNTMVIAAMMRSLSFLNYHKDEIGEDLFPEVIAAFARGIAREVEPDGTR